MTRLPDMKLEGRRLLVKWLEIGPGNRSRTHTRGRHGGRSDVRGRPAGRLLIPGAQMSSREYEVA